MWSQISSTLGKGRCLVNSTEQHSTSFSVVVLAPDYIAIRNTNHWSLVTKLLNNHYTKCVTDVVGLGKKRLYLYLITYCNNNSPSEHSNNSSSYASVLTRRRVGVCRLVLRHSLWIIVRLERLLVLLLELNYHPSQYNDTISTICPTMFQLILQWTLVTRRVYSEVHTRIDPIITADTKNMAYDICFAVNLHS